MNITRLLLLGAYGRTGNYLIQAALKKGYEVVVLIENPYHVDIYEEGLTVIYGTPYLIENINKAIVGCHAVISLLNKILEIEFAVINENRKVDFLERSMKNTLMAMEANKIKRIISLATVIFSDPQKQTISVSSYLYSQEIFENGLSDHSKAELSIKNSSFDWTLVRVNGITSKLSKKSTRTAVNSSAFVNREKLTDFILDVIKGHRYIQMDPLLASL